jgi:hypothetical protein
MSKLFNLSEEEKNRIRGLHLTESKDKRITSVLSEEGIQDMLDDDNLKLCFIVHFESGEVDKIELPRSGNVADDANFYGRVMRLLMQGMRGDRPFIDIEAGTSGTGSHDRNREVMEERVNQAIEFLIDEVSNFVGPNKLKYSVPAIIDKANIDRKYSRIEPGSIIPLTGEEVPTDPNDDYFKDAQYVQICINPVTETPDYNSLADLFIKATKDDSLGTDESRVYSILQKMRDKEDFEAFQEELRVGMYEMDFYEVVCDGGVWPFGKVKELPRGDHHGIDSELRRLGVKPIPC